MATIEIYEDITNELSRRVAAELEAAGGEDVTVRLCSGGGSVFAGHAIVARMVDYPGRVTVIVDGLAASAASFIAVGGGDEVVMSQGSELMIHGASADGLWGTAKDFRRMSEDLDRWTNTIAGVYAKKTGKPAEFWLDMMVEDRWFTAEEAVEVGLADRVRAAPAPTAATNVIESMVAKYDYLGRGHPAPANKSEDFMSWENLANDLKITPDELKQALVKMVKNEAVAVSGEVEVTYPEGLTVVPTEKITVEPTIGDAAPQEEEGAAPAPENSVPISGLTFTMGDVAEGFTAEVDETAGTVKITAPSGAEVGSTAEFTVNVNDTVVPLSVTVRSLSGDEIESAPEGEAPAPENMVSLDRDTFDLLKAQARAGVQMSEEKARKDRVAEVENWVRTGRIAAAARDKALSVMERDAALAREIYGSNPENTVPVTEVGHVGSGIPKSKADELLAKANAINNKKKGV